MKRGGGFRSTGNQTQRRGFTYVRNLPGMVLDQVYEFKIMYFDHMHLLGVLSACFQKHDIRDSGISMLLYRSTCDFADL